MNSAKNLPNAQNHVPQQPRHSSVLLWAALMMVMLSGLVYLGFKIKQQQIKHSTPLSTSTQSSNSAFTAPSTAASSHTSQDEVTSFATLLTTLQAQHVINPVMYKMSLILRDEANSSVDQNSPMLWQQGQKQLTVVKASVHMGVDLSELTAQDLNLKSPVLLQLPPARIRLIQIDDVKIYDIKTGQPSTVQLGLSLTSAQEHHIKAQIEREFCQSNLLKITTEETSQRVILLLAAIHMPIRVQVAEPIGCVLTSS